MKRIRLAIEASVKADQMIVAVGKDEKVNFTSICSNFAGSAV